MFNQSHYQVQQQVSVSSNKGFFFANGIGLGVGLISSMGSIS